MRTIWRFELMPGRPVLMPTGAKVLSALNQKGAIALWAEVDPDAPPEPRHFEAVGTGRALPSNLGRFLGTVLLSEGSLVFHVFEATP